MCRHVQAVLLKLPPLGVICQSMPAAEPIKDPELLRYTNRRRLAEERRRSPRQKAQIPAYSSFDSTSASAQLDLNAILDISERGIAIQASPPLEINRKVNLRLDLSDTVAGAQVEGFVVWSDSNGRAGISLQELPYPVSSHIREWLFLNLLHASARHFDEAPASILMSKTDSAVETVPAEIPAEEPQNAATADLGSPLVLAEEVRREVKALGADLDSALQLVSAKALALTRSTGAAIALSEGKENEMVCRAQAGTVAPPLGTRLEVGSGFSGECVRKGLLLRCDDAETDLRVDRESCRHLGIRSMTAAPILRDDRVVGLLEVFSPVPYAFTENDGQVLQGLSNAIADALGQSSYRVPDVVRNVPADVVGSVGAEGLTERLEEDDEDEASDTVTAQPARSGWRGQRIGFLTAAVLSIAAAVLSVGAIVYWGAPWIGSRIRSRTTAATVDQKAVKQVIAETKATPPTKSLTPPNTLEDLRNLAERGDPNAQFALGARFATGEQVKQDYAEAVTWFSKAAEQGHVVAQATLGAYYWAGRGVQQDLSQAYFWSILARAGGDEASKYRAAVLSSRMTRTQIAAVQQQADNWLRDHPMVGNTSQAR
jgi:putative methionine-R-sulfoxide reductase with GAF domain